jgi:hypothetical protein
MKLQQYLRWALFVALLPLVVLGLVILATKVYGLVRYAPDYFSEMYVERYETPGQAARALEVALRSGDQALLDELQGLRWPATFEMAPTISFVMLWERTDRYITYLYVDMETYERHAHYFEEVDRRWVVAPSDLYYYMNSGRWRETFMPIAIVWWLGGGIALVLIWLYHFSERLRARLYGE